MKNFKLCVLISAASLGFFNTSSAAMEDLWITEVDPASGEVEVTNIGSEPVTTTSALPFCYRFSYSAAVPSGTTFGVGESKVFTIASLNGTDSDLWLYTAGSFSNANLITSGLKWGPQSGVGRTTIASNAGKWSGNDSFVDVPPAGQTLQLTGADPFAASNWTTGEPNLGSFGTAAEPIEIYVTIENLSPENGTFLTPMWAGFHDGTFDIYDSGSAASPALERIAEDGNTGPFSEAFATSGSGTIDGTLTEIGPIAPGASTTRKFMIDAASRYFSYASMIIPSNDAFIANGGSMDHAIFDEDGNFVGTEIVMLGSNVLDAGTEVNDEIPSNTAFLGQMAPDTGDAEGGVVASHPGFMAAGSGGILDEAMFASADFLASGYQLARIVVSSKPPRPAKLIVTVENLAPENGTYITPLWAGFQDGSFDIYDIDAPASAALEPIAEDGNTGPLSESFRDSLGGIVDATLAGIGPIAPGASTSTTINIDLNSPRSRYFSYASMVIPSNDAFFANGDPMAHEIVDADGNFLGAEILVMGTDVLDAGTEVNDEVPANTAFLAQMAPNTGADENGNVMAHTGFIAAGSSGILDEAMFANGDFTASEYMLARVTVEIAPPEIIDVEILVENLSPENGTYITPVWVGFQNGTFDIHDLGAPASEGLERIAEDGNTTPLSDAFQTSGTGSIDTTLAGIGPIAPGASTSAIVPLNLNAPTSRFLSYASMVIPSNDAFVANGNPTAHEIIDADGNFLGAEFVVAGSAVLDAGTEVNDESPANTAFFGQMTPDTGDAENGTVSTHAGFLAAGSGGILDDPMFSAADFTADRYDLLKITVRKVEPRPIEVVVTVENLAPENGTFITPLWAGFHGGSFDIYDLDSPASAALERIAEDGNTGPLSDAFAENPHAMIDATLAGIGPIAPGARTSANFTIDLNSPRGRYFSYASMIIPSNDAFVANGDPMAHEIVDADGNFLGAEILIMGTDVLDAGTEVNDEVPANTAFLAQAMPDTGDTEGGVVTTHGGFMSAGSSGILDEATFAEADFTATDYQIARITIALRPPQIDAITADGAGIQFAWSGGMPPYQIQQRSDIVDGEWMDVGDPTSDTSATFPAEGSLGFFRVVSGDSGM